MTAPGPPAFDRRALAAEVLVQIRAAPSEWHRSRALRGIARQLAEDQIAEGGRIAAQLTQPEWRAAAQAALAAHARDPERSANLDGGLQAARSVVVPGRRAWAILLVVAVMHPTERSHLRLEVFSAIDEAQDPADLSLLLPDVPDEWVEDAAGRADAIPVSWLRAETLAALIARMALERRQRWIRMAVDAGREADDPGGKGRAFAGLVELVDDSERDELIRLALREASRPADEGTRSIVLTELARFLAGETLQEAWDLAAAMARSELRLPLLALLASGQGPSAPEHVLVVWNSLATTDDEWAKSAALMRLWAHLPDDFHPQAAAMAGSMRDPWARADLLAFLSARVAVPQDSLLLGQAIACARSAPSPWARARALTAILGRTEG